jgi:acetone carboxylase gamma subunit
MSIIKPKDEVLNMFFYWLNRKIIMTTIPNILHAIWLGKMPGEDVQKNLENWRKKNPDLKIKLWIDSETYTKDETNCVVVSLEKWAEENNIIIVDTSGKIQEFTSGELVYENMLCQQFYDDEINGKYANFAAASDILRVEILYQEGGIYIDATDIFPGRDPLGELSSKENFLIHVSDEGVNNDILASTPQNEYLNYLRKKIYENYLELYKNEKKLFGHRNRAIPIETNQIYGFTNYKVESTILTSGPGLYSRFSEWVFPEFYYEAPHQDGSWFGIDKLTDRLDTGIALLRNALLDKLMENKIDKVHEEAPEKKEITEKILKVLNAILFDKENTNDYDLNEILLTIESSLTKKELANSDDFITKLKLIFNSLNEVESYCKSIQPSIACELISNHRSRNEIITDILNGSVIFNTNKRKLGFVKNHEEFLLVCLQNYLSFIINSLIKNHLPSFIKSMQTQVFFPNDCSDLKDVINNMKIFIDNIDALDTLDDLDQIYDEILNTWKQAKDKFPSGVQSFIETYTINTITNCHHSLKNLSVDDNEEFLNNLCKIYVHDHKFMYQVFDNSSGPNQEQMEAFGITTATKRMSPS